MSLVTSVNSGIPFWVGWATENHVSDRRVGVRHLANTVERLCSAALSGSATRPLPKLLWAIVFSLVSSVVRLLCKFQYVSVTCHYILHLDRFSTETSGRSKAVYLKRIDASCQWHTYIYIYRQVPVSFLSKILMTRFAYVYSLNASFK